MKFKFFLIIIFIFTIYSTRSLCSEKFKCGIKTGIGLWRITQLTAENNKTELNYYGKYPLYAYTVGFSVGPFIENRLLKNLFLVNELVYQYSRVKVTKSMSDEGILEQNFEIHCINVPILIKYQTEFLWQTSILLGPSFSFLIRANYFSYDEIYQDTENENITDNVPTILSAIEFGLGEKIEMTNYNILMEVRTQIGLTKHKYVKIGNWQNVGLSFMIGLQI